MVPCRTFPLINFPLCPCSNQSKPSPAQTSRSYAPSRPIKAEPQPTTPTTPVPPTLVDAHAPPPPQSLPALSVGQTSQAQVQAALAQQLSLSRGLIGFLPNSQQLLDVRRMNRPIAPRPGVPMPQRGGVSATSPAVVQLLKMAEAAAARRGAAASAAASASSSQVSWSIL